jgi:hypothetical protein
MGTGYANDIYYNLTDGIISTPARIEWDLPFTPAQWHQQ